MKIAATILALAGAAALAGQNSTLKVVVVDQVGNPIPGAGVGAIFFNNGNPDPVASHFAGPTDVTGSVIFSPTNGNGLTDADFYQIVASTLGYTPNIVGQFNGGSAPGTAVNPSVSTPSVTITLTATAGLAEIDVPIIHATTGTTIFGQLSLQSGGGAVEYGMASITAGSGNGGVGTMRFRNISPAAANTYVVNAFDPQQNRAAMVQINVALSTGSGGNSPLAFATSLDFGNAPPPITNLTQTQQSGQGGSLSVSGILTDTTTASTPIPYTWISIGGQYADAYGQIQNDWRGTNSDNNGNFQFYGLLAGVTYYTSVNGACNGTLGYAGYQDAIGSFTANDFLYPSSASVVNLHIKLPTVPPSTGHLAVYVQDQFSSPFPQVGLGLWGDGSYWSTAGGATCGGMVSNPSYINCNNIQATTGYVLITGLASGNYNLNAWSSYGQTSFNNPNNGNQSQCPLNGSNPGPYYRLTIDTTVAGNDAKIYDDYGNLLNQVSSVTVTITVSTSNTGVVQGTLGFPSQVDLSQNPILVTLFVNCNGLTQCPNGGGYKVFNSAVTPANATYSIPVSSGYSYWMNIQSSYWGAVFPGGQQPNPDLTLSTYSVVNLQFVPAGRVVGFMRKPDGSAYVAPGGGNGSNPSVGAEGNNSWGETQINNDGSFTIGGLRPGVYTLDAQNWGGTNFPYTTQQPAPTVTVVANQDSHQDLVLANAVTVRPIIRPTNNPTSVLPALAFPTCPASGGGGGECPPETWTVLPLLSGTPLDQATISSWLAHTGHSLDFEFSPSTGNINSCNGAYLSRAGFCTRAVPAQPSGTSYDLYLVRKGDFDQRNNAIGGASRPYFVIEASSRNIVVSPTNVNDTYWTPNGGLGGSTTTIQDIDITPVSLAALPQAVIAGTVTITNLITQQQFQNLGGNFEKFLQYIPVVYLYDSTGTLRATGMVVPYPPAENTVDAQLNQAVQSGNFTSFQALMNTQTGWGPVGYEIRGLTAGTTYNLVVQTPNYPPYKATVALGPVGSTTTFNINLDQNPGATLSGVVTSTGGAAIAGAQVTIAAAGYGPTALTTSLSGAWSVGGLAAGQYQVNVVASGYAQGAEIVSVGGSGSVTAPTISLSLSGSSISGSVYTNNPICPPGSTCAAFGKTVLQGIAVVAYDDTLSGLSAAALPLYKTVTDSSGNYTLNGLVLGDAFTVFVKAPGYFVTSQTTTTVAGGNQGLTFSLKPKPLDVDVYGSPVGANYEFQIHNYKQFSSGRAWIGQTTGFSTTTATEVTNSFNQKPDSQGVIELVLDYPLSSLTSGVSYTLEIIAQPNDPAAKPAIKILVFGLNIPNNACQRIDEKLLGDDSLNAQGLPSNLAVLDASGANGSGLSLPVGGVIPIASTAVASMCMSQTQAAASPYGTVQGSSQPFLSGVYQVTLSSVNYAQGVDLTLSYNQSKTSLNDAAIYTLNAQTNQWQPVPGAQTLDPVRGTISIKRLKSLASVLSVGKPGAPVGSNNRFLASFDGHQHGINPMSVGAAAIGLRPDDSGIFAILSPSQIGGSFVGTSVKIYNFPNPFNLQVKNVPINLTNNACGTGGLVSPVTTAGTVIKAEVPQGINGQAAVRIYTLSGRLVRELDAGVVNGTGQCVYLPWDGNNRSGQPVADGIYYGIFTVNGNKSGGANATFKLAVVK